MCSRLFAAIKSLQTGYHSGDIDTYFLFQMAPNRKDSKVEKNSL